MIDSDKYTLSQIEKVDGHEDVFRSRLTLEGLNKKLADGKTEEPIVFEIKLWPRDSSNYQSVMESFHERARILARVYLEISEETITRGQAIMAGRLAPSEFHA